MTKELHYLSFGAKNNLELQRQLLFFRVISKHLNLDGKFYCFYFGDEDFDAHDDIIFIGIDQTDHFFEVFEPHLNNGTILFNHAFFYNYLTPYFQVENSSFIYHKLMIEYIKMKHDGIEKDLVSFHRNREIEMLENSDWVYLSSDRILNYYCDNDGYHNHNHSLLSLNPLVENSKNRTKETFYSQGVHYIHIGDVSNKGLKYIKKILKQSNNRFTLLSNSSKSVEKQGFIKDNRFRIQPLNVETLSVYLAQSDYALIKPPSKITDWIDIEYYLADILVSGVQLLTPKLWSVSWGDQFKEWITPLEENSFEEKKLNPSERIILLNKAKDYFNLESEVNRIRLRNLYLLHSEMVNKQ